MQERARGSIFRGTLARRMGLAEHKPHQHQPPNTTIGASDVLHTWSRAGRVHRNASGQPWLRTDHNRTLYFQPLAGLGNRLRALCKLLGAIKLPAHCCQGLTDFPPLRAAVHMPASVMDLGHRTA